MQPVAVRLRDTDPAPDRSLTAAPPVKWPEPTVTEVTLSAAPAGTDVGARAGGQPVWLAALPETAAPARMKAELLDRASTAGAGVEGVLIRLARTDGAKGTVPLRLTVGYAEFRHAFGGDWAARLRLVSVPECALTKPQAPACRQTPVSGQRNDVLGGRVSAELSTEGGLFAVTAGPSGSTGNYTATSLSPAATWSAGGSSGDFTWSYPIRTPPAIAGRAPGSR
ncbi:MAG TPA: hypothetical protein VFV67_36625 [Actinophytocola sp.]|uniref:hypothetical protein n=1 Tax=Actinophytocola sp. TaxID=1872138 RepID=UPI002DC026EE|nr:hypothetical protein [Actinophytocola sp.]HEU5476183.1 hypothetical protein [Actinophytocola sp.]